MILEEFVYSFSIALSSGDRATLLLNETKRHFELYSKNHHFSGLVKDIRVYSSLFNRPLYGDWIAFDDAALFLSTGEALLLKRDQVFPNCHVDLEIIPRYAEEHYERLFLSQLINGTDKNGSVNPSRLLQDDCALRIPAHKRIYRAVQELAVKGVKVDMTSVSERLFEADLIEGVGGQFYLDILDEYE